MTRLFRCFPADLLRRQWLRIILVSQLVAATGQGASLLVNHEFSAGLNGWSQIPTVFVTGETAVLSDQGGNRVVLFQSTAVPAGTAALTLSFDFLNALSDDVPLGSTPDSVFATLFLGDNAFGPSFDEGVYVTTLELLDADYRGPTNLPPGMVAGVSPKGTGWTRFTVPVPLMAVVTIGFEFINANASNVDSTAAVDNVLLDATPVPEPSAGMGILLSLVCGWLGRRRRRVVVPVDP